MSALRKVMRAVQFVENHLAEPVGVKDMADAACVSLFHFSRLFVQTTHLTPYDYLMRRRLSEAAHLLRRNNQRIIEIAFDVGFKNPETFSRAFRRLTAMPPLQWRESETVRRDGLLPPLTEAFLEHLSQNMTTVPMRQKFEEIILEGFTIQEGNEKEIQKCWEDLLLIRTNSSKEKCWGVRWFPEGIDRPARYMAAAQSSISPATRATTPPLPALTLPEQTFASFEHNITRSRLAPTLDYCFRIWLPQSGSIAPAMIVEEYDNPQEALQGNSCNVLLPLKIPAT